ncbi:MAG TPA: GvpL/GvpF family gas vesicle protein [Gemmatimonadaceae bacterium]|nr:GvpL/GvpF family gas vesicle protein [Gemmatimonadaceae bacterium]
MATTAADARTEATTPVETARDGASGWYLYGITRRGARATTLEEADAQTADAGFAAPPGDDAPLQLLECGGLAAVVRPVLMADFTPAVLQQRLRSASGMEAIVRSHNRVVEAIHAQQAILPARFGVVYADTRDIQSALRSVCDSLLPQLHRLEGCDEWALHLYANRAAVRERVVAGNPALARLREEFVAARPGRAYFLERQLREELEGATRQALATLARNAFDRLTAVAIAGQVNPAAAGADSATEVEILRAAFLLARDDAERFDAELCSVADASEGIRCECSGPWPPYSFAVVDTEAAQ